jgi:uncharacterized membrane protein
MIRQRQHPRSTFATSRTEAFTDGVFAIAATLLVLDLTTTTFDAVTTDSELWSALASEWMLFVNFALSFVLLCMMWMVHVSQFEHIARVDNVMIWLNNGRLLMIVLVPFSTRITTEYSEFFAGRIMLAANFFLVIVFSWLQWTWAVRHREKIMPDLPQADAVAYGRGNLSALLISTGVLVLSPFIGSVAFALFFFDGLLTKALRGKGD